MEDSLFHCYSVTVKCPDRNLSDATYSAYELDGLDELIKDGVVFLQTCLEHSCKYGNCFKCQTLSLSVLK